MRYPIYHIDAFTNRLGGGNPAAVVCCGDEFLDDERMQLIAAENNLSETAFVVSEGKEYAIRWFTPLREVDLCGHATLAAAFVLKRFRGLVPDTVTFRSMSGVLRVTCNGDMLAMEFPSRPPRSCHIPDGLRNAIGMPVIEVLHARDYLVLLENETAVRTLDPDPDSMKLPDCLGVIVSAPGDHCDFVSRFFAPNAGIAEDPVTGSSHCTLIPYWSARLGKKRLLAEQVSTRGGVLECEDRGETVSIAGSAVAYLVGEIDVSGGPGT